MRNFRRALLGVTAVALALSASPAEADFVLYNQDFEKPSGFVNNGGDINIFRSVNDLYGNQPAGFTFAQANTVETLLITGNQAFGTGYSDPQKVGGNYTLGMLSGFNTENDLLGLSFNLLGQNFLNFRLNISSIDLDRFGGPFNPTSGSVPAFDIVLFDNPTGATGLSGNGVVLDSARITGLPSSARSVFNWSEHVVALDAGRATNGNVTVRIDLVSGPSNSRYAALDNFLIVASNTPGAVPEPSTLLLTGLGVAGLGAFRFARRGAAGPGS
ncbi:MAG: PEP-CTERM sorting domain-containing protein [Isosphaeraceae bacterium]